MLEELLQEINACENLAHENTRKANADAKDILIRAQALLVERNLETANKVKELKADNIARAEAQAVIATAKIIERGECDAEKVRQKATKAEQEIINEIVGRLKTRYANS